MRATADRKQLTVPTRETVQARAEGHALVLLSAALGASYAFVYILFRWLSGVGDGIQGNIVVLSCLLLASAICYRCFRRTIVSVRRARQISQHA
ncbi:MAG: hypothetical protein ACR2PG_18985 [Hyphomicrobiaceae bacterium]